MDVNENIAVHSNKYLKELLEQSASDIDSYEQEDEDPGNGHNVFQPDSNRPRSSKSVDVLKMGEGGDRDWEWHDEDYKGNNIRFINQLDSQRIHTQEATGTGIMAENEENLDYHSMRTADKKLHGGGEQQQTIASNDHDSVNLIDSLDVSDAPQNYESIYDRTAEAVNHSFGVSDVVSGVTERLPENVEGVQFKNTIEKETEKSSEHAKYEMAPPVMNSRKLKAGFNYKEAEPKFIAKNRVELGKRAQGSYSQKFLERKTDGSSNLLKQSSVKAGKICTKRSDRGKKDATVYDSDKTDVHQLEHVGKNSNIGINDKVFDTVDIDNGDQQVENFRHQDIDMEIPMLEEMIREEEETLKNHIFDISLPELINNNYTERSHNGLTQGMAIPQPDAISIPKKASGNQNQVGKKENNMQFQTYAQLHSLIVDKNTGKQSQSPPLSYFDQHIEKKKKHVPYKMYSLKDYADLNKEIVLQRSLGPDKSSEEYLQKKARADRLKEYASTVSMQNKEKMVVKKARSAPAPVMKERMNESKRAAALEYAKSIKNANLSRKSSSDWSVIKKRPSSERTHGPSAVEIMKERHEAEKLAVEKMRQNLASIIKEVKS